MAKCGKCGSEAVEERPAQVVTKIGMHSEMTVAGQVTIHYCPDCSSKFIPIDATASPLELDAPLTDEQAQEKIRELNRELYRLRDAVKERDQAWREVESMRAQLAQEEETASP